MPAWIKTVHGAFVKAGAKPVNHGHATLEDGLPRALLEHSAIVTVSWRNFCHGPQCQQVQRDSNPLSRPPPVVRLSRAVNDQRGPC